MSPGGRALLFYVLWIIEGAAFVSLGWIGFALDFETPSPHERDGLIGIIVAWSKEYAPYVVLGAGCVVILTRAVRFATDDKSAEQKRLDSLVRVELDRFRKAVFESVPDKEPLDNNRVTVFRFQQWCWRIRPWRCWLYPWGWNRGPGSGWLIVSHRSGHATQRQATVFLAPDDAHHAEGIAGRAWRGDDALRVSKLPDLSHVAYVGVITGAWYWARHCIRWPSEAVTEYEKSKELVLKYASATFVSPAWVWKQIKKKKVLPLCLLGMPIETRDNTRWGVIVLDSSNEHEPIDTNERSFRSRLKRLTDSLDRFGVTRHHIE